MIKVAIVGAGFCGLAAAWHLLELSSSPPSISITLFDSKGIGQGASGISAGLLHPFSGAHAKLNWKGKEGVAETKILLNVAQEALGRPVTAKTCGILRLALTEMQKLDFRRCASLHLEETEWLDENCVQTMIPGSAHAPALWIREGITVYSNLYLKGLWQACSLRGVQFRKERVHSLNELSSFDLIIATTGAESLEIPELSHIPLHLIKGQVLELAWPPHLPPLPCPLNSHVYLVMTEGNKSCLAGATYEKGYQSAEADQRVAEREILPKACKLYPPLEGSAVLNCAAGMRGAGPQHRPLIKQLSSTQWLLTGMGSKGLLYHALFAKELVQRIF